MQLFLYVFSLLSVIVQHLLTVWDCCFPVMFSMSKIDLKFVPVSERMWILVEREKSFQLRVLQTFQTERKAFFFTSLLQCF